MEESENLRTHLDSEQEKAPIDDVEVVETPDPGEAEVETDPPLGVADPLAKALEDLQEASERADSAHQSHLRAVADLENYRKRMQREQEATVTRTTARMLTSLLPVLDSFDAALGQEDQPEQESQMWSGMKATYELLMGTLNNQGLEAVPAAGEPFSPDLHQPINAPPDGTGQIIVSDEVRRGYRHDGRLLRAALVVVTRENESV